MSVAFFHCVTHTHTHPHPHAHTHTKHTHKHAHTDWKKSKSNKKYAMQTIYSQRNTRSWEFKTLITFHTDTNTDSDTLIGTQSATHTHTPPKHTHTHSKTAHVQSKSKKFHLYTRNVLHMKGSFRFNPDRGKCLTNIFLVSGLNNCRQIKTFWVHLSHDT